MSRPQQMPEAGELEKLRQRIADIVARREAIKRAMEGGELSPAKGLRQLDPLDRELSDLDTAFKQGWDAQQ